MALEHLARMGGAAGAPPVMSTADSRLQRVETALCQLSSAGLSGPHWEETET